MATLRKRSGVYSIRFVKTVNGNRLETQFSLKTKSVKTAEKWKRRLETAYENGSINVFRNFDFQTWKDSLGKSDSPARPTISNATSEFLKERPDHSKATEKHYKFLLNQFSDVIGQTMFVDMITKSDIITFCFRSDLSPSTQNNYLRHLRSFCKWLDQKGYAKDVTKGIKKKKNTDKLKNKLVSESELGSILYAHSEHIKKHISSGAINKQSDKRIWFEPLVKFTYYSGLRLKEVTQIRWKDVSYKNREISVIDGKGGKARSIPMTSKLFDILTDWEKVARKSDKRYIFESPKSTENSSYKMPGNRVSKIFKQFSRKANLHEDVSFHSLRHSFATNCLRNGFDIHEVQKMMGHASVTTTEKYLHLVPDDLKKKAKELDLM